MQVDWSLILSWFVRVHVIPLPLLTGKVRAYHLHINALQLINVQILNTCTLLVLKTKQSGHKYFKNKFNTTDNLTKWQQDTQIYAILFPKHIPHPPPLPFLLFVYRLHYEYKRDDVTKTDNVNIWPTFILVEQLNRSQKKTTCQSI